MRLQKLSIFLLVLGLPVFGAAEELDQMQIKNLFGGYTASCLKTKDGSGCKTYMSTSGDVKRFMLDSNKTRTGTWHASSDNQLCIRWAGKTKDLCFVVKANEGKGYSLVRKGKVKSTIDAFERGDKSGF